MKKKRCAGCGASNPFSFVKYVNNNDDSVYFCRVQRMKGGQTVQPVMSCIYKFHSKTVK